MFELSNGNEGRERSASDCVQFAYPFWNFRRLFICTILYLFECVFICGMSIVGNKTFFNHTHTHTRQERERERLVCIHALNLWTIHNLSVVCEKFSNYINRFWFTHFTLFSTWKKQLHSILFDTFNRLNRNCCAAGVKLSLITAFLIFSSIRCGWKSPIMCWCADACLNIWSTAPQTENVSIMRKITASMWY